MTGVLSFGLIVGLPSPIGSLAHESTTPVIESIEGLTTASIFVSVTPDRAWDVLTDYEITGPEMPDIKLAKVISRQGARIKLAQTYQAEYTFGLKIFALLEIEETPKTQISYKILEGELIRSLSGNWTIIPVEGGTLIRHKIEVEPEIPEVLRPIFLELSQKNLSQSMLILRRLMLASP